MKIIGIDPGKNGGLALLENNIVMDLIPMPILNDKIDWIKVGDFIRKPFPELVIIEAVHSHPKQGVVSVFSFGMAFGGLLGVCGALGIEPQLVSPQKWQRVLLGSGKHTKQDTIDYVMNIYPSINLLATKRSRVPHDGMSDAIAIASYGETL